MNRDTYRKWTPQEEAFLSISQRPYTEIAKALRRTYKSVTRKAQRLGLRHNHYLPTYNLRWHRYGQDLYPEIYFGDYNEATAAEITKKLAPYNPNTKTTYRGYKRLYIEAHPDILRYIQNHPDPRPKARETQRQIVNWLRSRLTETGVAARLQQPVAPQMPSNTEPQ